MYKWVLSITMKKIAKVLALAACLSLVGACGKPETKKETATGSENSFKTLTECSKEGCSTELGNEMAMGDGTVRSYGVLSEDGGVQEIGVFISEAAVKGLPMNCQSDKASADAQWIICQEANEDGTGKMNDTMVTTLDVPEKIGKVLGISKLDMSWLPYGHAPENVWDLPQFDIHFPFLSPNGGEDEKAFYEPKTPSEQLPAGYMVLPGSGFQWDTEALKGHSHAADPKASPEFKCYKAPETCDGTEFQGNFLYITYNGKAIGYEAYVSMDLLNKKGTYKQTLNVPIQSAGTNTVPSQLTIMHEPENKGFRVSLTNYKPVEKI